MTDQPDVAREASVSPVRVAVAQFEPRVGVGNLKANAVAVQTRLTVAADAGARLVVLPELATTGYLFENRDEAFAHAEAVPDGPTVTSFVQLAAERNLYIAGCVAEQDGERLFDTAVLVVPGGYIGRYRKTHLWNTEKLWFTPGDEGFSLFDTRIGRIALLVCWDIWFPETARIVTQMGADIICIPTGWPIGRIAGPDEDTIIYADVDLTAARTAPIWNQLSDLHRDRRTDLYDQMLGYRGASPLPR
jgi:N-carbamoylputrescine amidase